MPALHEDLKIQTPDADLEDCPHLDDLSGDWFDIYAILSSPELIPLDGTCRDQIKLQRCPSGHFHLPQPIKWVGPIQPIGFAEFWERKASLTGDPLVRLPSHLRALPVDDRLVVGPGRLT